MHCGSRYVQTTFLAKICAVVCAVSNGNTGAAPPSPPAARNPLEELYGTPEPAQPSESHTFCPNLSECALHPGLSSL